MSNLYNDATLAPSEISQGESAGIKKVEDEMDYSMGVIKTENDPDKTKQEINRKLLSNPNITEKEAYSQLILSAKIAIKSLESNLNWYLSNPNISKISKDQILDKFFDEGIFDAIKEEYPRFLLNYKFDNSPFHFRELTDHTKYYVDYLKSTDLYSAQDLADEFINEINKANIQTEIHHEISRLTKESLRELDDKREKKYQQFLDTNLSEPEEVQNKRERSKNSVLSKVQGALRNPWFQRGLVGVAMNMPIAISTDTVQNIFVDDSQDEVDDTIAPPVDNPIPQQGGGNLNISELDKLLESISDEMANSDVKLMALRSIALEYDLSRELDGVDITDRNVMLEVLRIAGINDEVSVNFIYQALNGNIDQETLRSYTLSAQELKIQNLDKIPEIEWNKAIALSGNKQWDGKTQLSVENLAFMPEDTFTLNGSYSLKVLNTQPIITDAFALNPGQNENLSNVILNIDSNGIASIVYKVENGGSGYTADLTAINDFLTDTGLTNDPGLFQSVYDVSLPFIPESTQLASVQFTPTPLPTIAPLDTATNIPTQTQTSTFTPSKTNTLTPTQTSTVTSTNTQTSTPNPTDTETLTNTPTFTPTSTPTTTETLTNTPTQTPSDTLTNTQTNSPTNTQTFTPSPTNTPTETPSLTSTLTPSATNTLTSEATIPTNTSTNLPNNTQIFTPTETPTNTQTELATNTQTFTPSPTNTPTLTSTNTLTPTYTFTSEDTETLESPTYTPSPTQTPTSTYTETLTPTNTDTLTPTNTQTPTLTISPTVTNSPTATPSNTISPIVSATLTRTPVPSMIATTEYSKVNEENSNSKFNVENVLNLSELNLYVGDWIGPYVERSEYASFVFDKLSTYTQEELSNLTQEDLVEICDEVYLEMNNDANLERKDNPYTGLALNIWKDFLLLKNADNFDFDVTQNFFYVKTNGIETVETYEYLTENLQTFNAGIEPFEFGGDGSLTMINLAKLIGSDNIVLPVDGSGIRVSDSVWKPGDYDEHWFYGNDIGTDVAAIPGVVVRSMFSNMLVVHDGLSFGLHDNESFGPNGVITRSQVSIGTQLIEGTKVPVYLWVMYGHMQDEAVETGHILQAGDIVGHVGKMGNTVGSHLDFTVFIGTIDSIIIEEDVRYEKNVDFGVESDGDPTPTPTPIGTPIDSLKPEVVEVARFSPNSMRRALIVNVDEVFAKLISNRNKAHEILKDFAEEQSSTDLESE